MGRKRISSVTKSGNHSLSMGNMVLIQTLQVLYGTVSIQMELKFGNHSSTYGTCTDSTTEVSLPSSVSSRTHATFQARTGTLWAWPD